MLISGCNCLKLLRYALLYSDNGLVHPPYAILSSKITVKQDTLKWFELIQVAFLNFPYLIFIYLIYHLHILISLKLGNLLPLLTKCCQSISISPQSIRLIVLSCFQSNWRNFSMSTGTRWCSKLVSYVKSFVWYRAFIYFSDLNVSTKYSKGCLNVSYSL